MEKISNSSIKMLLKNISKEIIKTKGVMKLVAPSVAKLGKRNVLKKEHYEKSVKIYWTKKVIEISLYLSISSDVKANLLSDSISSWVSNYIKKNQDYSNQRIKILIYVEGIISDEKEN